MSDAIKPMVSPKGEALWAHLFVPDEYMGNVQYKVNLVLDREASETHDLIETLENIRDRWWEDNAEDKVSNPAKRKKMVAADVCEPDTDGDGGETGGMVFKFKANASFTDRSGNEVEIKPQIFDAFKRKLDEDPGIGNGSLIKVAFKPIPYAMAATGKYGVSLRLIGVQVIEAKGGGSNIAAMFDDESSGATPDFDEDDAPF